MLRPALGLAIAAAVLAAPAVASAGPYSDDLAKCLVRSSSTQDKELFVTWVFAAISVHPSAERYSKMTEAERTSLSRQAGALTQRLLTQDCRKETVLALKYERSSALETAFGVFGEVAMTELMTNKKVNAVMENITLGFDEDELLALFKEAGVEP